MDELTVVRDAFRLGPEPDAAMLARAQQRLSTAIRAEQARTRSIRRPVLVLAATLAVVVAAGIAVAATTTIFDRDVTREDLDARVTTVTRTIQDCRAPGDCDPPRPQTRGEVRILVSDGISFVDPEGNLVVLTPAAGTVKYVDSMGSYARELSRSLRVDREGKGAFELPGGVTRTLSWVSGAGTITVTDRLADGTSSRTTLRSGDVVPLVPGTLENRPLTPDKAVAFELAQGEYIVWIYPQRNEAYVAQPPWLDTRKRTEMPVEVARRYELRETEGGAYTLPIDPTGGAWSFRLDGGTVRTIHWNAGERTLTVTDTEAGGEEIGRETVPIGTQLSAG